MRVFTFILLIFVLNLLRNSVHGSGERLHRVRSAIEAQHKRQAIRVPNQTSMITLEQIQEQFGKLVVHTPQSSSSQRGSKMPLLRPILTQHGRTDDSASSSRMRDTPRPGTVDDMEIQMHTLGLHGQNNNHEHAMLNPNAPPPLPRKKFDYLSPGSLISVMIKDKSFFDVGMLYTLKEDSWPTWVFHDHPIKPFGPNSAWISVPDSNMHHQPRRDRKDFAAQFKVYLPYAFQAPDYKNPRSEVFITNGEHVYHAALSLNLPRVDNNPSVVSVIGEIQPDTYRCLHGTLDVWDTRYPVPEWVLRKRPIWL